MVWGAISAICLDMCVSLLFLLLSSLFFLLCFLFSFLSAFALCCLLFVPRNAFFSLSTSLKRGRDRAAGGGEDHQNRFAPVAAKCCRSHAFVSFYFSSVWVGLESIWVYCVFIALCALFSSVFSSHRPATPTLFHSLGAAYCRHLFVLDMAEFCKLLAAIWGLLGAS